MSDEAKTQCNACGAPLLPAAAAHAGAACPVCGSTAAHSERRRWRGRHGRVDPYAAAWTRLVQRVNASPQGFDSLSKAEQWYFCVGFMDSEIHRVGFERFLENSTNARYAATLQGLEVMEAADALKLLREAKSLVFGPGAIPDASRGAAPSHSLSAAARGRLGVLDGLWWQQADALCGRCQYHAILHGIVSPPPET